MTGPATLTRIEDIIDGSGVAPRIEALLPTGVRHRQLTARTLLTGMMLTLADDRPAHLTRVHATLTALPVPEQIRPSVVEDWKAGPHQLTCRQAEYTFNLKRPRLRSRRRQPGRSSWPPPATWCPRPPPARHRGARSRARRQRSDAAADAASRPTSADASCAS